MSGGERARSMAAPGSDAPSKETRGQAPPPADVTRPASLPPCLRRGTGSTAPGTASRGWDIPLCPGDIPLVTSPWGHPPLTWSGPSAGTTPAALAGFCPGGADENHNESQFWLGHKAFVSESVCTWRQPG